MQNSKCVAVIADVVGSRSIAEKPARFQLQDALEDYVRRLNSRYAESILAAFTITTGDEFQGLLKTASPLADILTDLDLELPVKVRIGIGLGELTTRLQPTAIGMDGPAWHAARDAIIESKEEGKFGGVFLGFGESDPILNGFARLLVHFRHSLVRSQRDTLIRMRERQPQSALVGALAPSKQAVHERIKSIHWNEYREGDLAFREVLRRFDYSGEWPAR